MENKHLHRVLSEDDRVPFKLPKNMLNNPNSIDLKGMGAKAKADADAKAAAEARAKELAANKEKYKDLISRAQAEDDAEKQLEVLFEELVPSRGKADTVAGELVRAMMRILYRDYNDGDLFYEGYGIETCGGSVAYLISMIESLHNKFGYIAERQLEDDAYTAALNQICYEVCEHIFTDDSVWQTNEDDSREEFDRLYADDYRREWEPEYDYDFQIPPTIQEYIEAGHIIEQEFIDQIEMAIEGHWGIKYDNIEDGWSGYININGLNKESYDELESWRMWEDSSWSDYIDELRAEYGDLEEEDDEDEEDNEDIDESLSDTSAPPYKVGDKVKYRGKVTTIVKVDNDPEFGVDYLIVNPDYDETDSRYENIWVGDMVDSLRENTSAGTQEKQYFAVMEDGWAEDSFDTEDEAIEFAEKHGYDSVQEIFVTEDENGNEVNTKFGDIVWSAEDYD